MKKTITFAFDNIGYDAEVSRWNNDYPKIYTAYCFDDTLRKRFHSLVFIQEAYNTDILPTLSSNEEEASIKRIILEKIIHKKDFFD